MTAGGDAVRIGQGSVWPEAAQPRFGGRVGLVSVPVAVKRRVREEREWCNLEATRGSGDRSWC